MIGRMSSFDADKIIHWSGVESKLLNTFDDISLIVKGHNHSIILYANLEAIENLIELSSEPDTYITIRDHNHRLILSNLETEPLYIKDISYPVF